MGDWDGWTRGVDLSAEDVTSDAVFARFEGVLSLRPGRYRVKLKASGAEGGWVRGRWDMGGWGCGL
jgi:hypothetical protein